MAQENNSPNITAEEAKKRVLEAHPESHMVSEGFRDVVLWARIVAGKGDRWWEEGYLGDGPTEDAAWLDAYRNLPRPESTKATFCEECGFPAYKVSGSTRYAHDLPQGIRYSQHKALHPGCWDNVRVIAKPVEESEESWQAAAEMHKPKALDGVALIAAERKRQVESEGWTPEHDDVHEMGELPAAAMCYAAECVEEDIVQVADEYFASDWWPWDASWWKPSDDPIRNLVKAGALIAAEIDRLQRKEATHV